MQHTQTPVPALKGVFYDRTHKFPGRNSKNHDDEMARRVSAERTKRCNVLLMLLLCAHLPSELVDALKDLVAGSEAQPREKAEVLAQGSSRSSLLKDNLVGT